MTEQPHRYGTPSEPVDHTKVAAVSETGRPLESPRWRTRRRWVYLYFPLVAVVPCIGSPIWVGIGLLVYVTVVAVLSRQRRYDLSRFLKRPSDGGYPRRRDRIVVWVLVLIAIPTLTHGGLALLLGFLAAAVQQEYARTR